MGGGQPGLLCPELPAKRSPWRAQLVHGLLRHSLRRMDQLLHLGMPPNLLARLPLHNVQEGGALMQLKNLEEEQGSSPYPQQYAYMVPTH